MVRIAFFLLVTFFARIGASQVSFQRNALVVSPQIEPKSSLEWLDVEGDGDTDFLAFYPNPATGKYKFRLYYNDALVFQGIENPIIGGNNISATAYFIADGDHDNDADILFIENRKIWIAKNNGDRSFSLEETNLSLEVDGNDIFWVDMDGDTDLDIVTDFESVLYAIAWNLNGTYAGRRPLDGTVPSFADVNDDGKQDIFIVSGNHFGLVRMFIGSALFQPYLLASNAKPLWADFDNDTDLDAFALTSDGKWTFFRNSLKQTGSVSFVGEFQCRALTSPVATAGDVDANGLPDIIISGGTKTYLYLNMGAFSNSQEFDLMITPASKTSMILLDIDHQKGLDLFFQTENGDGSGRVYDFFLNTLTSLPPSPQAPTGLSELVNGSGKVTLSWLMPPASKSFRLEIFKEGNLYASSESAGDGTPLRVGNTPARLQGSAQIANLSAGNYSWRVQAIDAVQRGSPFSVSRSFHVSLANQLSFEASPLTRIPVEKGSTLEWLDVEGDGDMDFLSFYPNPFGIHGVKLFENIEGSFHESVNPFTGGGNISATAFFVADGTMDNLIDFLFIENREIRMARNNGDKTFTIETTGVMLQSDAAPLSWLDVDADGDLDIITKLDEDHYAAFRNQRNGPSGGVIYPANFDYMSFADLSNDGFLDFFTVVGSKGHIIQSTNLTSGFVTEIAGATFGADAKALWVDIDNDKDTDLIANATNGWQVFKNMHTETGQAKMQQAFVSFGFSSLINVGDINSDGLPDVVQHDDPWVILYTNQSSGGNITFERHDPIINAFSATNFRLLDIDKKNGLDILTNDVIHKNTLSLLSAPPQPPGGLSGRYNATLKELELFWTTAGPGLNYRIEISKDGGPYLSASSGPSGALRSTHNSPHILANTFIIRNVGPGNYAWKIQSVDASYRASSFSDPKQLQADATSNSNNPVTGLEDFKFIGDLTAYPNPATDMLTVTTPGAGKLSVADLYSKLIYSVSCAPEETIQISVKGWSEGLYIITFASEGTYWVKKVMVRR